MVRCLIDREGTDRPGDHLHAADARLLQRDEGFLDGRRGQQRDQLLQGEARGRRREPRPDPLHLPVPPVLGLDGSGHSPPVQSEPAAVRLHFGPGSIQRSGRRERDHRSAPRRLPQTPQLPQHRLQHALDVREPPGGQLAAAAPRHPRRTARPLSRRSGRSSPATFSSCSTTRTRRSSTSPSARCCCRRAPRTVPPPST